MPYYGVAETIKNGIALIYSRVFFNQARLIRLPFYVRGKKYISFGKNMTTGYGCRFEVDGKHTEKCITIGDNVNFGDNNRISSICKVIIGNNVLFGSKVLIIDNSHGSYQGDNQSAPDEPPNERKLSSKPVIIEDNVWIGEGVVIQQGVVIGYSSIVAANSVVTKSVPPKTIVGGCPATIIKEYNDITGKWQ